MEDQLELRKKEIEQKTEQFQPKINNKNIDFVLFFNEICKELNNLHESKTIPISFKMGKNTYSFRIPLWKFAKLFDEFFKEKKFDDAEYSQPEPFLENAKPAFEFLIGMMGNITENIEMEKQIGYEFTSLNAGTGSGKWISYVPIDKAIEFFKSLKPRDFSEMLKNINLSNPNQEDSSEEDKRE